VLAVFVLAWRSRRADGRSATAGAVAGLAANLGLAAWAPGVSWLWWNVTGLLVALAVGEACGRSRGSATAVVAGGRGYARLLVAWFTAILALLACFTLAV
jgi:SSS family solute:Na+ symporter